MILRKSAIEIPPHAHASFEVYVAKPDPVAKADRLEMCFRPLVKRNVLMPGASRAMARIRDIVLRGREVVAEALPEEIRREESGVLQIDDFDRFRKGFYAHLSPVDAPRTGSTQIVM